jgi:hypothetical protein
MVPLGTAGAPQGDRVRLLLSLPDIAQCQLNRNDQQENGVEVGFHGITSLWGSDCVCKGADVYRNILATWTSAGPRITTSSAGMMKKTSGKTILMAVLAAASSAICLRLVRRASA